VTGADVASAARRLRNDGFRPVVERVRNEQPRDRVIAQDPRPGKELEVGDEVTLTVSDGPGTRAVPDVEGLTRKQARAKLRGAGFRVREREEANEDVRAERVIRTLPPSASEIAVGATVTMVVSTGPEQVTVPNVVGQDVDEARDRLEAAGLKAEVRREDSSDEDPGTVLRQDPGGQEEVESGSEVTLVVAEEPEEVSVPDVRGRSESEAVSALSSVGLEVNVEETTVDRPSQDGVVQRQAPRAGQRLERGKRVTITVGRFEPDPGTGDDEPTQTTPETSTTPEGTTTGTSGGTAGG
jgi:serine/threonine-protein kinase